MTLLGSFFVLLAFSHYAERYDWLHTPNILDTHDPHEKCLSRYYGYFDGIIPHDFYWYIYGGVSSFTTKSSIREIYVPSFPPKTN